MTKPAGVIAGKLPEWHAFAALMGGNVCLAMGPWFVRLADVGPIASGFWRLALALPFLLLAMRITGQRLPEKPAALTILICGGLFFAIDLICWHNGIVLTKLGNAALFGNIASFFFAAYGFARARAMPRPMQWIAMLLAIVGAALLLGRSFEISPRYLLGDLLCIAAGLFYACYLISVDRVRGQAASWPILVVSTLAAAPPLFLIAWFTGQTILPGDWTPLVALSLGSQVIGQGLLVYAIGQLSPVVVGIGLLSQPALAAAIGWMAYRERLAFSDIAGMLAIALALVLIRSGRPTRPATQANAG